MKKNKVLILSTLLCLAPILLGLALYPELPDVIPTHFGLDGTPDGWSSKPVAVFGLPAFMAGLNLLCHGIYGVMRRDIEKSTGEKMGKAVGFLYSLCFWIPSVTCLVLYPITLYAGLGRELPIPLIVSGLVGVLFIVVGNYLPKVPPNRFMGIRVPWTFASEENWWATHRFGGKVWVVCGFGILLGGIFDSEWLVLPAVFGSILLPIGYSWYMFYYGHKK